MRTLRFLLPILIVAAIAIMAGTPAKAYGIYNQKSTTVSLFAAMEANSDESGYGISVSTQESGINDISYIDMDSFRMAQTAKLSQKMLFGQPMHIGLTIGYADSKVVDAPQGVMGGIQVILARSSSKGFSIDLRAASMSENFNPFKWVSDPDILWAGAGISYTF